MRHAPALSIAAAGAVLPLRLGAAGPDPAFLRLAAEAWMSFNHPLLRLFFFMAILSLLAAALLNRRHRTELLATCLALSVVLHLLSLSVFSLLPIQNPEPAAEPPRTAHRIKMGTRIANESRAGWRVREEPLKFDRADARDRTLTQRPAGKEPVAEPIQKTQTAPREPIARAAKQEDFTIPAPAPAKKNVDETLGSLPDHMVKAAPVRIEIPKEDQPDRKDARKEPDSGAVEIDVGPAARAAMPHQALKPEAPKLESKKPAPLRVQAKIKTAAVEPRQPEVKDAIQHSAANPAVDRLELPAGKITNERGADKNDASGQARPGAEVTLDKRYGGAAQPAVDREMMEAAKSAGQTRMSADSLADDSPGSIDGKQNEVQSFPGGTRAISTPDKPVRIKDVLPTLTAARSPVPGQAAGAPAGQRSLTAAREKSAGPGLNAAGERPRPEHNNAAPARAPVRVGLGGETPAEPTAKSPSVRDAISQVSSEQPGLPALGTPLRTMELAANNLAAAAPEMNNAGAQSLAAGKISGALATSHAAAAPVAPTREGRSQNAGTAPGFLVDMSGAAHGAGKSAAAAIKEQTAFAQAGDGNSIDHGLVVVGAPAQALESARGNMPAETPRSLPAALSDSRARHSAMPSEAGAIERPAPAGRSNLRPGAASFIQHGRDLGVAARPAASPSPVQGDQAESPALLALAGGDAKALAGRMRVEKTQGEDGAAAGQAEGGAGQAALAVDKAGGQALAAGAPARRFQAQAGAGIGTPAAPPATLLVQPALMAAGRPAASGTAENESLTAHDADAGAADSSGPALLAPTLARQNTAPAETPVTGGPGGRESLQLAKITADEALLFEPNIAGLGEIAETMGGADGRGHSRMDVALNAAAPRASVTADISAAPPGRDGGRSFLPAGKAPTPDFVPEIAIYKMRKPEKRKQFIKELGGTPETEEAAEQALSWLSRAQSDDGRWDVDGFKTLKECGGAGDLVNEDVGVTGLVLLAYLGAGYTHLDGAYQETVRKGLDWLLSCEKGSGDFRGAGQMYGQAMATTALCESYALTGDERLLEPTRRAVRFILDSQTPESGWRYASQNESDTSVTGWQILALKSAQIAGFDVPEQTFRWMNLWLDKVRQGDNGGLYSYKPGHVVTPVMTAEGAFCQLFMGGEAGARAQAESVAFIMQNLPVWDPENRSVHIYYWYYATLTMYLSGASEFEAWNSALTKALLQGRNTSGPAKGSWDPVCLLGVRGGRIYTTAVGALCLEVYYRFLPLYKQKQP